MSRETWEKPKGKDKIKRAHDKICSLLINEYEKAETYLKNLRENTPADFGVTESRWKREIEEIEDAVSELFKNLRKKMCLLPPNLKRTKSEPLLQISRGGRTRRKKRRKRRRTPRKDFDKELRRVIAQWRRSQIARGDKRFKATKGLVKWSRPNKTKRPNRVYYRKRKTHKNH